MLSSLDASNSNLGWDFFFDILMWSDGTRRILQEYAYWTNFIPFLWRYHHDLRNGNSRNSKNLSPPLLFSIASEFKKIKKFNSNIEFASSLLSITSEFKEIKKYNSNIDFFIIITLNDVGIQGNHGNQEI